MDVSGNLKAGLFVGLIVSIALYHISNILKNRFFQPVTDVYTFVNLIQFVITVSIFFLVVYNKLIIRLILRDRYIGGTYEGKSTRLRQTDEKWEIERFIITQNLFETTISGKSFDEKGEIPNSIWTGHLFKIEGNTYYFGIELSTETREFGVMTFTVENDNAHGFYYSGTPETQKVFSYWAKRAKRSMLADAFQW